MKKFIRVGLILLLAAVIASPVIWWYWPYLRVESAMLSIRSHNENHTITTQTVVSINTYRDEVSSSFIKNRYNRAARMLSEKSSNTKTYRSTDPQSWGRIETILQYETGYISITAGCGNDSESFSISFISGEFDESDTELLSSYQMPSGILRCDWQKIPAEQDAAGNPLPAE